MSDDTLFDKIIRKEIDAKIVYEDENVLAFHDINPQAPVHVLVIPKRKVATLAELQTIDPEYVGIFMQAIGRIATDLGLGKNGYRVVFNSGRHGQQTVAYLHAHIIGGRQLKWPPG